jgi:hypothetical protein
VRRAALLLVVSLGAACLDAPPSGVGAPVAEDAASPVDGALDRVDAGADAGGNLLVNGDFELGVNGWVGLRADIGEESATVHGGAGAAWACLYGHLGSDTIYGIDSADAVVAAPAAGTYQLQAWVRALPGASAQDMSVSLRLTSGDVATSPDVLVADAWTPIGLQAEVSGSGGLLVRVRADSASAGDCIAIDDVVLTRE